MSGPQSSRSKMLALLLEQIEDERKAVRDYGNLVTGAQHMGLGHLARTYQRISRDEEQHHNDLVKEYNKLYKEAG